LHHILCSDELLLQIPAYLSADIVTQTMFRRLPATPAYCLTSHGKKGDFRETP
jgi:hypothetical protein